MSKEKKFRCHQKSQKQPLTSSALAWWWSALTSWFSTAAARIPVAYVRRGSDASFAHSYKHGNTSDCNKTFSPLALRKTSYLVVSTYFAYHKIANE